MKKYFIALFLLTSSLAFAGIHTAEIKESILEAYNSGEIDIFSGPVALDESQLKGLAKKNFQKMNRAKNCKNYGYCPQAFLDDFNSIQKGLNVVRITYVDDGSFGVWLYTQDGQKEISSCFAGESGDCILE